MTDEEAKERAKRIIDLTEVHGEERAFLVVEVARELQRVATESGWQKEDLKRILEQFPEIQYFLRNTKK